MGIIKDSSRRALQASVDAQKAKEAEKRKTETTAFLREENLIRLVTRIIDECNDRRKSWPTVTTVQIIDTAITNYVIQSEECARAITMRLRVLEPHISINVKLMIFARSEDAVEGGMTITFDPPLS